MIMFGQRLIVSICSILCTCLAINNRLPCSDPVAPDNGNIALQRSGGSLLAIYSCKEGYQINGEPYIYCRNGYWDGSPPDCEPERTKSNIRITGRFCRERECITKCVRYNTGKSECRCTRQGYFIGHNGKCQAAKDPCFQRQHGCSHQCINDNGKAKCVCPHGFTISADNRTCHATCAQRQHGCSHQCINDKGKAKCVCPRGFKISSDKKTCHDVNECLDEKLNKCQQNCHNLIGSFSCSCSYGYYGVGKHECRDVNECRDERFHKCQHKCNNFAGGYNCSCFEGYHQIGEFECVGCKKGSYLDKTNNTCIECPENSNTRGNGANSLSDCMCLPSFEGNPGERIPCTDIDECRSNELSCSHLCINTQGSAFCSCPQGYHLSPDMNTCIDANECAFNNGGCEGICTNTLGSFNCHCSDGYLKSGFYSCMDIDECAKDNGGCSQLCANYPGRYNCLCHDGHRLLNDETTCTAVTCPPLLPPSNSLMNCSSHQYEDSNNPLPEAGEVPVGTTCSFKCHKGYKLSIQPGRMECDKNGHWIGKMPECIIQKCPPLNVSISVKVHPESCIQRPVDVLQKCYLTCDAGYKLVGSPVFTCARNRTWIPNSKPQKHIFPNCQTNTSPYVECPNDVAAKLEPNANTSDVYIAMPKTNVDYSDVLVNPNWIKMNSMNKFAPGHTIIVFTAGKNNMQNTSCVMTITVIDNEQPVVKNCPESFIVNGNSTIGATVNWIEPTFTDNVGIKLIHTNMEPNIRLRPGQHIVRYTAFDVDSNTAMCEFTITVTSPQCGYPMNVRYGHIECEDWSFGRMCEVQCYNGFVLYPEEPLHYFCGDDGIWEPAGIVQDCTRYEVATSASCNNGFEWQYRNDTGEICVECPSNYEWLPATRSCIERDSYGLIWVV